MNVVNIKEKFELFTEHWSPKVVGELNGQAVKLAKLKGEFIWHDHKDEDEMFLIIKGSLIMEFRDKTEEIGEGEFIIVPKGVEHRPIANEECLIMLFEPIDTKHTGEIEHELTVKDYQKI